MALNYEVASYAARVNWYSNDNYRSIEIKFRGLVDSRSYDYIIQSLLLIWKNKWDSTEQIMGLPCGSDGKESSCNAGDPGLISVSGRSPGEGDGKPLQYSYLENSTDRGAWWATVHGVTELDMTE